MSSTFRRFMVLNRSLCVHFILHSTVLLGFCEALTFKHPYDKNAIRNMRQNQGILDWPQKVCGWKFCEAI